MAIKEFEKILTDGTEIDILEVLADPNFLLGQIYINLDDDSESPQGFFTVNGSGDEITLRFYVKDNSGIYKSVDSITVANDSQSKMPPIGDDQGIDRDIKVTAQLSNFVSDVRITGHYEERFRTSDIGASTVSVRGLV